MYMLCVLYTVYKSAWPVLWFHFYILHLFTEN